MDLGLELFQLSDSIPCPLEDQKSFLDSSCILGKEIIMPVVVGPSRLNCRSTLAYVYLVNPGFPGINYASITRPGWNVSSFFVSVAVVDLCQHTLDTTCLINIDLD